MASVRSSSALVTASAEFPFFLNVRNFGALGNGAHDDTSSIQLAINALPVGGGTVYFPTGTYRITAALSIVQGGVVLLGAGPASVIDNRNAAGAPAFHVDGGGGFISGGSIEKLAILGVAGGGAGIQLDLVVNYTVRDVGISAPGDHGIWIASQCLTLTFDNVQITLLRTGKNGFHITTTTQCNAFRWTSCEVGGSSATSAGIYSTPFPGGAHVGWTITGCVFEGIGTGIWLNALRVVMIIGSYFEANAIGDIRIGTAGDIDSDVIGVGVYGAVANGGGLGGYFLSLEFGQNISVLGVVSRLHAACFSIVSPVSNGSDIFLVNIDATADTLVYAAGTIEGTQFPGPIKGLFGINGTVPSGPVLITPRNLRGSEIITGVATVATVIFPIFSEDDANYFVQVSIGATAGGPAAGSTRAFVTGKAGTGFTINLEAAPGGAASVTVDWLIVR